MVSPYKQMPYFLTKWVGEELCMTYHRQYGVPATSMRFATVIEPGEFLNEDGLPGRLLLSEAVERFGGEAAESRKRKRFWVSCGRCGRGRRSCC